MASPKPTDWFGSTASAARVSRTMPIASVSRPTSTTVAAPPAFPMFLKEFPSPLQADGARRRHGTRVGPMIHTQDEQLEVARVVVFGRSRRRRDLAGRERADE